MKESNKIRVEVKFELKEIPPAQADEIPNDGREVIDWRTQQVLDAVEERLIEEERQGLIEGGWKVKVGKWKEVK